MGFLIPGMIPLASPKYFACLSSRFPIFSIIEKPAVSASQQHSCPNTITHRTDRDTTPTLQYKNQLLPFSQGVTLREAEAGRKLKFFRLPTTTTKDRRAIDLPLFFPCPTILPRTENAFLFSSSPCPKGATLWPEVSLPYS